MARPQLPSAGRPDSQPETPGAESSQEDAGSVPDALLWAALCQAPEEGIPVAVQIDFAVREWLKRKGVTIKTERRRASTRKRS